jgi:hypothetical protein
MKLLLFGILLLSYFSTLAQINIDERIVEVYEADPILAGDRIQYIPVNFDASELLTQIPSELKSLTIERIDLVYTTYKESPEFDQEQLNRNRIKRLKSAWPETKNPLIHWNVIGQSQAMDKVSAKSFFHGFVVYYREKPTKESIERELDLIEAYMRDGTFPAETSVSPSSADHAVVESSTVSVPTKSVSSSVSEIVSLYADGSLVISEPKLKEARKRGKTPVEPLEDEHPRVSLLRNDNFQNECYTSKAGVFKGSEDAYGVFNDSMMSLSGVPWASFSSNGSKGVKATEHYYIYYLMEAECDTVPVIDFSSPFSWDSKEFNVVQATFERHPQWKNTQIVMDVTGSMSPYIAKTMAWIKSTQDSSQVDAFTFFNDGNATLDRNKRVGKVGGIYCAANTKYNAVYKRMKHTMRQGGGGDCPENNIEATLYGVNEFPDCDEVIMVADNWATPRDLILLRDVKIPIHIIVCGGQSGINVKFIQAAYETGGSVHTIEDDLDLRSIEPGKQFKIGRNYFTLVSGKIVRAEHK